MDLNRNNMDLMFSGFKENFTEGFQQVPDTWQRFATPVASATSSNIYPFLEQFGGMREWIGDRKIKNVTSRKLEIVNRDFEDSISIPRNDIEDDQYGIYGTMIAQMGYNAGKIWQDLAVEALLGTPNWIDGIAFFAASGRSYNGTNSIANLSSNALTAENYATARQTMMEFRGHNGKLIGVTPNLLIVGPKLEKTAFSILKDNMMLAGFSQASVSGVGAVGNPWNGTAELLVLPELSGTGTEDLWFLAASHGMLKPVMVQQRKLPTLVSLDRDSDENVFRAKEYLYGADARGEAFLAFPHLIYKGGVAS